MIRPRRFWRPQGGRDVPALLSGLAFIVAVAWTSWAFSGWWADLFPGATVIVPALMGTVPAWTREGRRLAWFFGWSLAASWASPEEARAEVLASEAEREVEVDEGESHLSLRARYVVRLWTEDGRCFDCELPMKRWARLRVGGTARVCWKGGWVTSIEACGDDEPAPRHESSSMGGALGSAGSVG
jgi:hypothetical protein